MIVCNNQVEKKRGQQRSLVLQAIQTIERIIVQELCESRWTSWAVRPNELSGFRGRKELLNCASALVTTCP